MRAPAEAIQTVEGAILLRERKGRTAAIFISAIFALPPLAMGFGAAFVAFRGDGGLHLWPVLAYALVASPALLVSGVLLACRQELWLDRVGKRFLLLTFRPWLREPRAEAGSLEDYAGVLVGAPDHRVDGGVIVSLVTPKGEDLPLRVFPDRRAALRFTRDLASATGYWVRGEDPAEVREGADPG